MVKEEKFKKARISNRRISYIHASDIHVPWLAWHYFGHSWKCIPQHGLIATFLSFLVQGNNI